MFRRALIFTLVLAGCAGAPAGPASAPNPMLGRAVTMALPSDQGALVHIPLPGAHATVLEFFSPTCVPCRQRVPAILAVREELEAKGAQLVLVAVLADSESSADAAAALEQWGAKSSFLVDNSAGARRDAGVEELPHTMIVDAAGGVVWVAPPACSAKDVVAAVP
jgi:protein-disulfide isomerase